MPEAQARSDLVIEITREIVSKVAAEKGPFYERNIQDRAWKEYGAYRNLLFPSNQQYSPEIEEAILVLIRQGEIIVDLMHDRLMINPNREDAAAR